LDLSYKKEKNKYCSLYFMIMASDIDQFLKEHRELIDSIVDDDEILVVLAESRKLLRDIGFNEVADMLKDIHIDKDKVSHDLGAFCLALNRLTLHKSNFIHRRLARNKRYKKLRRLSEITEHLDKEFLKDPRHSIITHMENPRFRGLFLEYLEILRECSHLIRDQINEMLRSDEWDSIKNVLVHEATHQVYNKKRPEEEIVSYPPVTEAWSFSLGYLNKLYGKRITINILTDKAKKVKTLIRTVAKSYHADLNWQEAWKDIMVLEGYTISALILSDIIRRASGNGITKELRIAFRDKLTFLDLYNIAKESAGMIKNVRFRNIIITMLLEPALRILISLDNYFASLIDSFIKEAYPYLRSISHLPAQGELVNNISAIYLQNAFPAYVKACKTYDILYFINKKLASTFDYRMKRLYMKIKSVPQWVMEQHLRLLGSLTVYYKQKLQEE